MADTQETLLSDRRTRIALVVLAVVIFISLVVGLSWLAATPGRNVGLTLAFAAGLSMILLPCTFPLIFVIIPLSMGQGYRKGLIMALLFGLGLTITLGSYGVAMALIGKYAGLDKATRIMWGAAGTLALAFGLRELKLITIHLPTSSRVPRFIHDRPDYSKSFFMGLLLGNAGIGCPNPSFYALLTYIASVGNAGYGALLGITHGIGRAMPLIGLSILAILGLDTTSAIMKRKTSLDRFTGWAMVFAGAFILMNGIFGHLWYESSIFHSGLNKAWAMGGEPLAEAEVDLGETPASFTGFAPWLLLLTLLVPVIYDYAKNKDTKSTIRLSIILFLLWLMMYPF